MRRHNGALMREWTRRIYRGSAVRAVRAPIDLACGRPSRAAPGDARRRFIRAPFCATACALPVALCAPVKWSELFFCCSFSFLFIRLFRASNAFIHTSSSGSRCCNPSRWRQRSVHCALLALHAASLPVHFEKSRLT